MGTQKILAILAICDLAIFHEDTSKGCFDTLAVHSHRALPEPGSLCALFLRQRDLPSAFLLLRGYSRHFENQERQWKPDFSALSAQSICRVHSAGKPWQRRRPWRRPRVVVGLATRRVQCAGL